MSIYQLKQSVSEPGQGCAVTALLQQRQPLLSAWYAAPLSRDRVSRLQVAVQDEQQARLCNGVSCFQLHVLQLVCRFQRQADVELEYQQLLTAAQHASEQALLELVYGQLLTSCKQAGAHQHLTDGFVLAADYLSSTDYFQLLRQHELLAWLPLSESPSLPQALASLLAEAVVIKQLQGGADVQFGRSHLDTLG